VITTGHSATRHNYGVKIGYAAGTVTNAGTISGGGAPGLAILFDRFTGNQLIDDPGAVFNGKVNGGASTSILELGSGASTGTLSGLGVVMNRGATHFTITLKVVGSMAGGFRSPPARSEPMSRRAACAEGP
jgi:hypothetical protein